VSARTAAPRHGRAPRTPFLVLILALFGGGMVLLLGLNTASAANEVQRHDLAAQDASVAAQVAQLQIDVANSSAPGNLQAVAAQIGMVPAGNPAFLQIGPDGRVRLLGSPAPATAPPLPAPHVVRHTKPRPSPKTSATAKATAKASAKATAKATATSTAKPTGKTAPRSPSAAPTPTPTPTIALPGGTR
jgi:hypothetical protein